MAEENQVEKSISKSERFLIKSVTAFLEMKVSAPIIFTNGLVSIPEVDYAKEILAIDEVIDWLREEGGIPIFETSDGGVYLWNGTLEDLPDKDDDPEGIVIAIELAKKLNFPIPTGKSKYQGRGRPHETPDGFIGRVKEAIRIDKKITQEKLAEFLDCDIATVKRNVRKAGFPSYRDFLSSMTP